jgi:hypothetical protein
MPRGKSEWKSMDGYDISEKGMTGDLSRGGNPDLKQTYTPSGYTPPRPQTDLTGVPNATTMASQSAPGPSTPSMSIPPTDVAQSDADVKTKGVRGKAEYSSMDWSQGFNKNVPAGQNKPNIKRDLKIKELDEDTSVEKGHRGSTSFISSPNTTPQFLRGEGPRVPSTQKPLQSKNFIDRIKQKIDVPSQEEGGFEPWSDTPETGSSMSTGAPPLGRDTLDWNPMSMKPDWAGKGMDTGVAGNVGASSVRQPTGVDRHQITPMGVGGGNMSPDSRSSQIRTIGTKKKIVNKGIGQALLPLADDVAVLAFKARKNKSENVQTKGVKNFIKNIPRASVASGVAAGGLGLVAGHEVGKRRGKRVVDLDDDIEVKGVGDTLAEMGKNAIGSALNPVGSAYRGIKDAYNKIGSKKAAQPEKPETGTRTPASDDPGVLGNTQPDRGAVNPNQFKTTDTPAFNVET